MEDRPYRIADCYSADRAGHECVQRKVDDSIAGYLIKVENHWEIEEPAGSRRPIAERRAYVDIHEAALIVHMRGRAHQRSFDIGDPLGPFQIRLAPEGDERGGWIAGIWQQGRVKGSFCGRIHRKGKIPGTSKATHLQPDLRIRSALAVAGKLARCEA